MATNENQTLAAIKERAKGGRSPPLKCWMCLQREVPKATPKRTKLQAICKRCCTKYLVSFSSMYHFYHLQYMHYAEIKRAYPRLPRSHTFREDIELKAIEVNGPDWKEQVRAVLDARKMIALERQGRKAAIMMIVGEDKYKQISRCFPLLGSYAANGVCERVREAGYETLEEMEEYAKWALYKWNRMQRRSDKLKAALGRSRPVRGCRRMMEEYVKRGLTAAARLDKRITDFSSFVEIVRDGELAQASSSQKNKQKRKMTLKRGRKVPIKLTAKSAAVLRRRQKLARLDHRKADLAAYIALVRAGKPLPP
jgi:hypothetical protein